MKNEIDELVQSNKVVLFMKGNPEEPMCGFSKTVVDILKSLDIKFVSADVLANHDLRLYLKEYSDWPTFPQLYVNGSLIGGCDIVREMHNEGELKSILNDNPDIKS